MQLEDRFRCGVVWYSGTEVINFLGFEIFAVPIGMLWAEPFSI